MATKRSPGPTSRLSKVTPVTSNRWFATPPVAAAISSEVQRGIIAAPPYRAAMGRGTIHRRVNGGGVRRRPLHHSAALSGPPPHELRSRGGADLVHCRSCRALACNQRVVKRKHAVAD